MIQEEQENDQFRNISEEHTFWPKRRLSEEAKEKYAFIIKSCNNLSLLERKVLLLMSLEMMTLGKAASILGISRGSVQVVVKRARKKILKMYKREKRNA